MRRDVWLATVQSQHVLPFPEFPTSRLRHQLHHTCVADERMAHTSPHLPSTLVPIAKPRAAQTAALK